MTNSMNEEDINEKFKKIVINNSVNVYSNSKLQKDVEN